MKNCLDYFENITWNHGYERLRAICDFNENGGKPQGRLPGLEFRSEADRVSFAQSYFQSKLDKEAINVRNQIREHTLNLENDKQKISYVTQIINTIEAIMSYCREEVNHNRKYYGVEDVGDSLNIGAILSLQQLHIKLNAEYAAYLIQSQKAEKQPEHPDPKTEPKPEHEILLLEIKHSENKFWKGLPMDRVIKHFEVLTLRSNKNGVSYLSNQQFISFLKKGFLKDDNQPKQHIHCSRGEKGLIIKRFYEFFVLATSEFSHPQQKAKFISLFIDCFDNWEQKTVELFFKPNKTKQTWQIP